MRHRINILMGIALALAACGRNKPDAPIRMDGQTVVPSELSAADVARGVVVTTRDGRTIYRAPVLSQASDVDLRRGGPGLATNLGTTTVGRLGLLYGVREGDGRDVRHFAAFQSDFVEGANRFAAVKLADGTALPLRTAPRNRVSCEPTCYLVFETLIAEVPEPALRAAITSGLNLTIVLDNGTTISVTVPPGYVRGYLMAVDAPRGAPVP